MTEVVNMHQAKSSLSRLVERALAGEEIVIARNGEPLVKLVPVPKERKPRVPGRYKGKIWIAPDCFELMNEEELDLWEKWDHWLRLLIDSHAFLWWSDASPALGTTAHGAIADPANEVLVSVAALWELTIKTSSGKLSLPADLETMVASQGFAVLSIKYPHLRRLAGLPRLHRDPFNRMMIAQALAVGIPTATSDRVFAAYGVRVVW